MATELEYTLSYTGNEINEKLRKVDDIDIVKALIGDTPVSDQITNAVSNIKVNVDNTLKNSGSAADAKATGDAITNLSNLVGTTPVADQIAEAIVEVYVQDEAPSDAPTGSIWVDTSATGQQEESGKPATANVYAVNAGEGDISSVDFSNYAIGDVVIVYNS